MEVKTRDDDGVLEFFSSISAALKSAETNQKVWKISWDIKDIKEKWRTRERWVRKSQAWNPLSEKKIQELRPNLNKAEVWIQQDLCLDKEDKKNYEKDTGKRFFEPRTEDEENYLLSLLIKDCKTMQELKELYKEV